MDNATLHELVVRCHSVETGLEMALDNARALRVELQQRLEQTVVAVSAKGSAIVVSGPGVTQPELPLETSQKPESAPRDALSSAPIKGRRRPKCKACGELYWPENGCLKCVAKGNGQ